MKQDGTIRRRGLRHFAVVAVAAALAVLTPLHASARKKNPAPELSGEVQRVAEEKTGTLATHDGLRLRLVTDIGNVRILTGKPGEVSYRVRIETDAREPDAQNLLKQYALTARNNSAGVQLTGQAPSHNFRGRLWVSFEVTVPRRYELDVLTQAGSIEAQDIEGRVVLVTSGGNITAGRVGGPQAAGARLETQGGHINVQDVNGELRAITAGGYINAASVRSDAMLRSGGGHIRVGTIQGTAQLETGGGNISVQRAGGSVTATTGGGQIDFGEAAGSIRARTGGGGIRVLRVAGPMQLETGGGSIFLTKVEGAVRASTGAGSITAWFTPDSSPGAAGKPKVRKLSAASQLETGQGDIVVYLPRELAANIEAIIETAGDHHIEADPALNLKMSYPDSGPGGRVRGECALNGGGEVLRLKTIAGNIRLKFSDTEPQIRLNEEHMKELRRRLELQQQRMMEWQRWREEQIQRQVERQVEKAQRLAEQQQEKAEQRDWSRLEEFGRKLEELWMGGVRVDPDQQQKKLIHSVRPVYPDVAKRAGIQGTVRLKVFVGKDGAVESVKALSGEPILIDAATQAVRQWRYQPTLVDGKPVNVVTSVTVEFRLK